MQKKLKVPGVQGFQPQRDLLTVFNQINTGYAAVLQITIRNEEQKYTTALLDLITSTTSAASSATIGNTFANSITTTEPTIPDEVSVQTLISDFLQASYLHQKPSRIHGSVFATTLTSEESPYRKRTFSKIDKKDRAPCPCGDGESHDGYWGECPYICPSLQGKNFKKDSAKAKKVAEFENSTAHRKKIITELRQKAKEKRNAKRAKPQTIQSDSEYIDAGDQVSDFETQY